MKRPLTALALLSLSGASTLDAANLFIQGGVHFGGDTLATAVFVGGDTENVEAGGLYSASVGVITDISESLEVRSAFGVKLDGAFADNGDVVFRRFPVELMAFTTGEELRFGAGLSYHLSPELEIDDPLQPATTIAYDDSLGLVAQLEYRLGERGHLGLKATLIDYELDTGVGAGEFDGNSLGLIIGTRF